MRIANGFAILLVVSILGCTNDSRVETCLQEEDALKREQVDALIVEFLSQELGRTQAAAYERSYEISSIKKCERFLKVVYSPRGLPDQVGSDLHFEVDLEARSIKEINQSNE